jgi:hypothetical protein
LQAGVDRAAIALWLGHESVETTQIYLEANLAMKEEILAKTTPPAASPAAIGRVTDCSPSSRIYDQDYAGQFHDFPLRGARRREGGPCPGEATSVEARKRHRKTPGHSTAHHRAYESGEFGGSRRNRKIAIANRDTTLYEECRSHFERYARDQIAILPDMPG